MHATRRPSRSALLAIGLGLLWIALAFVAGVMPARAGSGHSVEIVDFAYVPAELTITVGDTVTFTNRDAVAHTATADDGSWDTGLLDQDESASITFTAPGTYDYYCEPHPSMTGRIVVQAAAPQPTATPTPSQGGGGGPLPDVAMSARPAPRTILTFFGVGLFGIALLLVAVQAVVRGLGQPDEG